MLTALKGETRCWWRWKEERKARRAAAARGAAGGPTAPAREAADRLLERRPRGGRALRRRERAVCTFQSAEDSPVARTWNVFGMHRPGEAAFNITVEVNIPTKSNS